MRRIILMFAAAFAVACSNDNSNSTGPTQVTQTPTIVGLWNLSTINGQVIPTVLGQNDTAKVELLSGTVTLATDGNFVDGITVRVTLPSGVTLQGDTIRGTYTTSGSMLLLQPVDGNSPYSMDITDSNTLTESDPSFVIVYHRQ